MEPLIIKCTIFQKYHNLVKNNNNIIKSLYGAQYSNLTFKFYNMSIHSKYIKTNSTLKKTSDRKCIVVRV